MATKSGMTTEDIDRYIDWVKQYGLQEAQRMQREVTKNKKKMEKLLQK